MRSAEPTTELAPEREGGRNPGRLPLSHPQGPYALATKRGKQAPIRRSQPPAGRPFDGGKQIGRRRSLRPINLVVVLSETAVDAGRCLWMAVAK